MSLSSSPPPSATAFSSVDDDAAIAAILQKEEYEKHGAAASPASAEASIPAEFHAPLNLLIQRLRKFNSRDSDFPTDFDEVLQSEPELRRALGSLSPDVVLSYVKTLMAALGDRQTEDSRRGAIDNIRIPHNGMFPSNEALHIKERAEEFVNSYEVQLRRTAQLCNPVFTVSCVMWPCPSCPPCPIAEHTQFLLSTSFPIQRLAATRFCAGGMERERAHCTEQFLRRVQGNGFMLLHGTEKLWGGTRDPSAICKGCDPVSAGIMRFMLLIVNDMEAKVPVDTASLLGDIFDALDQMDRSVTPNQRKVHLLRCKRKVTPQWGKYSGHFTF